MPRSTLIDARSELRNWINQTAEPVSWPDASRAARTLWLRARSRATRVRTLDAVQSEETIMLDERPVTALKLKTGDDRWVAVARHADLAISIAARELDHARLRLEPLVDPAAHRATRRIIS